MWENSGSHSAGYAFDKFGIGEKRDFTNLKPGDFLSFDRLSHLRSFGYLSWLYRSKL
jgi:hypothetical protein